MSNDNGKNPMPNDRGNDLVFTAFENLNLYGNYNCYNPGEASNNNHPNVNVYNVGHISVDRFNVNAPPFIPTRMIQPGASSSRSTSAKPFFSSQSFVSPGVVKDRSSLSELLDMMTCVERFTEFQKFLQRLDTYPTAERESHLSAIGSLLTKNNWTFLDLAANQYGSQALRTLFKRSPVLDHLLFGAVCMNFFPLMTNRCGRGLIIPAIRAVDKTRKEDLYRLTYEYTLDLARLETGCLALNDVFQEIRGKYRDLIFECVVKNADWLSFDPYGTHVVQNFLTLQNPGATTAIAERLRGSFFRLAKERLGSYVVEKCLNSAFARDKVLEEFRGNDREWVRMANDKFGNFVAQCALKVMKEKQMTSMLGEFLEKLRPYFCKMKTGHGKNTLRVIQEEIEGWSD
ncbi:PREDICTED: putative pumilio homolog 21 [Camelina sativa]|uniref:Pumilio homolog 21 n=1 Tax=Camelina sativa TaxID=90675 RepID=A0ABM0T9N3_CAMSA|nr:PREDICTED: putative pumilio homolog 21 [Camelina sativa]